MPKIILATTSPHRIKAFNELQIPYESIGSEVNEYFLGRPENPRRLVQLLAKMKAQSVLPNNRSDIILGMDSVAYFQGQILEKPKTREEAQERLRRLSGEYFRFITGVHLIQGDYEEERTSSTGADMRQISDREIEKYLDQDSQFKTFALGFDPMNTYGATFIKTIDGSYNNLLRGIPLEVIIEMLNQRGIEV